MKWTGKHRGSSSPQQLRSPLIAEDGLAEQILQQDTMSTTPSGSQASPPHDGPDAVLIDKESNSSRHSRDKSRSQSPGMNGTGVSHGGGITQRTQIQVTRRAPTVRSGWKLKYQDFLPTKKPDYNGDPEANFRELLDKANDWLAKNHDVSVKTCETVTWVDHDVTRLGDNEQLVLCKRMVDNIKNYHLRGLRLWLIPQPRKKSQYICYSDIVPDNNDTIPNLVNKINREIQQNESTGKILTLESMSVPVINGNVDSGVTRWSENVSEDSPYAFSLRLFYDKNAQGNGATVGIQDFIPVLSEDEGYEGFDQLSERANMWLKDQPDVIVTNMQSVLVQKDDGPHSETGQACHYSMPGLHNEEDMEFFRILRVSFIRPNDDAVTEVPMLYPFTYEIFCPELVPCRDQKNKERLERLKEVYFRINTFLKSAGADIISVETVMNPMQMQIPDDSAQVDNQDEIMQFMLSVRLFLTDQLTDGPDGSLKAGGALISLNKMNRADSHPGPIFLKNVVNRNYKYRWIAVAISVFTCMTIIVVISVIYSNQ